MNLDGKHAERIAWLLIFCAATWLAFEIPRGRLTTSDELFTAERSREMLLLGSGQVHLNFEPSYSKPPLQYWLTTLTLSLADARHFLSREVAVRIWPLVFGILSAMVLIKLARSIDNSTSGGGLVLLSVAALVSCPLFTTEISRALLDSGLMLFTTLAIYFSQLARTRPKWWLGVAICCWLGTLQKVPLIFLIWAIIVLVRSVLPAERGSLRTLWLFLSFIFAVTLSTMWPALQLLKYHARLDDVLGLGEFASRVHYLSHRPYLEIPFRTTVSWIGAGTCALIAPIVLLFRKEKRAGVTELSVLCLSVTLLAIISNARSMRYLVPIVPCFCLLLAILLEWIFERSRRIRMIAAIFAFLFFTIDIVEAELMISFRRSDAADQERLVEEFGALQQPGLNLSLIRRKSDDAIFLPPFCLFYGNLRTLIAASTVAEFEANPPGPPVLGICAAQDFATVREKYPTAAIQRQGGEFICWRAEE